MPRAVSQKFTIQQTQLQKKDVAIRNPIFNKDFGQHILKNPLVAQSYFSLSYSFLTPRTKCEKSIVEKANLRNTDIVLEVGPGTGNLTIRILDKCRSLTAIEMDPRLAAELQKRIQLNPQYQKKLELIIGDVMKTQLPFFDVCISNTPYQISSPLVFKLLSHRPIIRCAVLMFQKEFAQRLIARPGSSLWSRLSVNVQLYSKVNQVISVGRNNFRPPPKVDSVVVKITPLDPPPPIEFSEFDGLTRICFGRRNKTLRANFGAKGVKNMMENNFKVWASLNEKDTEGWDVDQVLQEVLVETGFEGERAAKLDVTDFLTFVFFYFLFSFLSGMLILDYRLLAAFHKRGIHFA